MRTLALTLALQFIVVVLFASQDVRAEPVRWSVIDGGNGHFYDLILEQLTWADAKAAAEAMTYNGTRGHLVTITSEPENSFIIDSVFDRQKPAWIGLTDSELFGGRESSLQGDPTVDGWLLVTGEPVEYTRWAGGYPNNQNEEDFVVMGSIEDDLWNDGQSHWLGYYIVEYGDSIVRAAQLFYNNSSFDANGLTVDANDFAAIAHDKEALRFGYAARFANISGFSRGINGIFFDIADLPNDGAGIDAEDFGLLVGNDDFTNAWIGAPAPTSVGVLPNEGEDGADRVYLTFADGAIVDTWLRVTVKANADTSLAAEQDFFFGSAPGETGAAFTPGVVAADAADLQSIARSLTPLADFGSELVTEPHDVNRDGTINAFDLQVVALNLSTSAIDLITPQIGSASRAVGVPEPCAATIALVAICVIAAPGRARQCRSREVLSAKWRA
jgi:hypothetical protein